MDDFIMNEDLRKMCVKALNSTPTDYIDLSREDSIGFMDIQTKYLDGNKMKIVNPPKTDIFIAKTIPIYDMYINLDNQLFRVCILSNYINLIDDKYFIGVVEQFEPNSTTNGFIGALILEEDNNTLGFGGVSFVGSEKEKTFFFNLLSKSSNKEELRSALYDSLTLTTSVWYGIQISLLHPVVKEVIKTNFYKGDVKIKVSNKTKTRKSKTCYVKKIVINKDVLKDAYRAKGKFSRHTQYWYVIGHWRTYTNGKKIFIKPYWKGPLREMAIAKESNIETRERKVINTISNN